LATLGVSADERAAIEAFRRDVIEPSMTMLVMLDFWAEWCGPCKQLTPVLEQVAAAYADRGVMLAKVNVDEQKLIAAQFQVQSIPTVYAIFQGQIVADLTQARTAAQLGRLLDQLLKQLPIASAAGQLAEDLAPHIAAGEQALADGDVQRALILFQQLSEMAPEDPQIAAGLARALLAGGAADEAQAVLDALPEKLSKDSHVQRARAALTLADAAPAVDDLGELRAKLAADPTDSQAAYELAGGLMAAGDHAGAADLLLGIIAHDRNWHEGAARIRLLTLFEAVGLEDSWVATQRRKLSAILFT
jgi:putative thioredoxin